MLARFVAIGRPESIMVHPAVMAAKDSFDVAYGRINRTRVASREIVSLTRTRGISAVTVACESVSKLE